MLMREVTNSDGEYIGWVNIDDCPACFLINPSGDIELRIYATPEGRYLLNRYSRSSRSDEYELLGRQDAIRMLARAHAHKDSDIEQLPKVDQAEILRIVKETEVK